ncbi:hypothetical protein NOV72_00877 [Caballeronia novacaledonica]|uniref:Uncharacterized protein n=1 Tax=Caballeronia novacaledonica TaxID=1544861 RepID=A0A2U3I0I9_9BURK|nr:hypothetical protein [Caballeronia novacaledonica]SPB13613.1 hypothetical protein NOV72_00877 [Caballeronia novacaledonica]
MGGLGNQPALVIRRTSEKMLARAGIEADWQTRTLPEDGACLDADLIVLGVREPGRFNWQARVISLRDADLLAHHA